MWPEPEASAASVRTVQLLELLQSHGHEVWLVSDHDHPIQQEWAQNNLAQCLQLPINRQESFDRIQQIGEIELFIYDRFICEEKWSWGVSERFPNAKHILDTQDLHSLRRLREKALPQGFQPKPNEEISLFSSVDFQREIASILRSDLSLVVSAFEQNLLNKHPLAQADALRVAYQPFFSAMEGSEPTPKHERRHFLSLGNFRHAPNWDAVQYLVHDLWPKFLKISQSDELRVVGAYPRDLGLSEVTLKQQRIKLLGQLTHEELKRELWGARGLVAPLRFGAGIKGKVLDAIVCETPIIGSAFAWEGIYNESAIIPSAIGFLCLSEDEFLKAMISVQQDSKGASERAKVAKSWYKSWKIKSSYDALIPLVHEERNSDLRGALQGILKHEFLGRQKYFSKWIEGKEKWLKSENGK